MKKFVGRVVYRGEIQQGIDKSSLKDWVRRVFVVEYIDSPNRKLAIEAWDDLAKKVPSVGRCILLSCYAHSKEFNGKWYTKVYANEIIQTTEEEYRRRGICQDT